MYNVHMLTSGYIDFAWDDQKAESNIAKHHGVTFEEAATAFDDPYARVIDDPDHSDEEERFILIGISLLGRVLVVPHCLRDGGSTIRIISARRAEGSEEKQYRRYRG